MIFGDKAVYDTNLKSRIIEVRFSIIDWLNNSTPSFAPMVCRPVDLSLKSHYPTAFMNLIHYSRCWKAGVKNLFNQLLKYFPLTWGFILTEFLITRLLLLLFLLFSLFCNCHSGPPYVKPCRAVALLH